MGEASRKKRSTKTGQSRKYGLIERIFPRRQGMEKVLMRRYKNAKDAAFLASGLLILFSILLTLPKEQDLQHTIIWLTIAGMAFLVVAASFHKAYFDLQKRLEYKKKGGRVGQ
jgi:hypothetical protein